MELNIPDELFNEEELKNTPKRYEGFLEEWAGNSNFKFTVFDNPGYDQMIVLKNIDFSSLCSHHLLPFHGVAHVGYIPDLKICGISKLARVIDKFASRPQIQERMTQEIADFIDEKLQPKGVMVIVSAQHDCMRIRGVKKQNSHMVTSAIKGEFRKNEARNEFLKLVEECM